MAHARALPVGRGLIYVAIAATAWGTGGAVAALLYRISGLGPVAVSFWRFAGAVVLLTAARCLCRGVGRSGPSSLLTHLRGQWPRLVLTGVGLAVSQTAYFVAVGMAGLAVATVVTLGSGPVLVAAGAHFAMRERAGIPGALAVGTALAGLVLIVGGGGYKAGSAPVGGVAFALLSGASYAGVTLLTRALGSRANAGDPYDSALAGFAMGGVCLLPIALVEGLLPAAGDPIRVIALLGYLGLVPTALAYALFFAGLAAVRATTASVIALVEAATAAVIAVVGLGERLTVTAVVGAVVLLGPVVILAAGERRRGVTDSPSVAQVERAS